MAGGSHTGAKRNAVDTAVVSKPSQLMEGKRRERRQHFANGAHSICQEAVQTLEHIPDKVIRKICIVSSIKYLTRHFFSHFEMGCTYKSLFFKETLKGEHSCPYSQGNQKIFKILLYNLSCGQGPKIKL